MVVLSNGKADGIQLIMKFLLQKISLEWNLFYQIQVKEIHTIHGGYLTGGDFLELREESLLLHTIQSARLNTNFPLFSRLPSLEQAIII